MFLLLLKYTIFFDTNQILTFALKNAILLLVHNKEGYKMIIYVKSPGLMKIDTRIFLFDSSKPREPDIELKQIDVIIFDPKKEFLFAQVDQGEKRYVLFFKTVEDLDDFIKKLKETIGLPENSANFCYPGGLTKLDQLRDCVSFEEFSEKPEYKELLDQ